MTTRIRTARALSWVALTAAVLTGCGTAPDDTATPTPDETTETTAIVQAPTPTPTPTDEGTEDVVGDRVCRDYRDLIADADLLTDDELRERLVALEDLARSSTTPAIAKGARGMLAAHTDGDVDAFGTAADALSAACEELSR